MVQLLLRYGASVDQPSHNVLGMTPLHFACSFERSEVVRALLQQGATVPRVADNGMAGCEGEGRNCLPFPLLMGYSLLGLFSGV